MHNLVYKYIVEGPFAELKLPKGGIIRKIAEQHGRLCFWVEFTTNAVEYETEIRSFRVYGTGHPIERSQNLEYLDTVIMVDGMLVWHIYEVIR